MGNRFFFTAADLSSTGTGREPWVCDGTPAGTTLVKDVAPGTNNSSGPLGGAFDDVYYWSAQDGTSGKELWRSDGTTAGTWRVKDIRPGPFSSTPREFCVSGGKLFFSADDGTNGKELWVSDGTQAGTQLVKDIFPHASFAPDHITQDVDTGNTSEIRHG